MHAAIHRRPATIVRETKDDDDDQSVASSVSILSQLEYERDYYRPLRTAETQTFQDRWESLQKRFERRHELLEILAEQTPPVYIEQLQEREKRVKLKSFQGLLDELEDDVERKRYIRQLLSCRMSPPRRRSMFQRIYNTFVFEWHTSIPAIYCLIVHSIAHSAQYEGLNAFLDAIKSRLTSPSGDPPSNGLFYSGVLFVGLLMMRLTGDLYWWLPDYDYDIVRYDFQNRLRLGWSFVNVTLWVRKHSVVRAAFFMIGYHLCYVSSCILMVYLQSVTDQKTSVFDNLPSNRLEVQHGVCYAAIDESFCSKACQDEIERQDLNYTWSMLSLDSYEKFWQSWVLSEIDPDNEPDCPPLFRNRDHIIFCFATMVACIVAMRLIGFKFWDKY